MIEAIRRFTLPAAYALLPPEMESAAASALLLAIGLQESQFVSRRQSAGGPARGFWQFEQGTPTTRGGVTGVMLHNATGLYVEDALADLQYEHAWGQPRLVHAILEDNDTLACVFARLLLWTLPAPLPQRNEAEVGWAQYLAAWRPGAPHRDTWNAYFTEAWQRVDEGLRTDDHPKTL